MENYKFTSSRAPPRVNSNKRSEKDVASTKQPTSSSFSTYKYLAYNEFPNIVIEEQQKVEINNNLKVLNAKAKWTIEDTKYEKTKKERLPIVLTGNNETKDNTIYDNIICETTGTIRGVKHKVRNTLAAFNQSNIYTNQETQALMKSEAGSVVVYTTTNGIVRKTFHMCLRVKTILATLQIQFEERDVFLQSAFLKELKLRLATSKYDYYKYVSMEWEDTAEDALEEKRNTDINNGVLVPQVYVDGRHLGGAARVEALNECGKLKTILEKYKSSSNKPVCQNCGNYRFRVCEVCQGSKKSPIKDLFKYRRNLFAGKVQLKCTNCDKNGLVPCKICCNHS